MIAYAFYEGNSRIQQYATALAKRGDTVDVICLGKSEYRSVDSDQGVNIHGIQNRSLHEEGPGRFGYAWRVLLFLFRSAITLTRMHLKNRFDVIHVHSVPDFLVFAAVVPKISGASIILDIHDILPEFYATKFGKENTSFGFKLLVLAEKMSIAFSDHVIIANPIWKERLLGRSVQPGKVTTIGNHPNPDIFFARPKERSDGKIAILYPGSLNWHQGLDIAVQAFAKVAHELPEAEFHIYGGGPERQNLETLVQQLGVRDRVKFNDSIPTEDIVRVMSNADLAVVPKRAKSVFGTEAASTKILEFMSVGVPVLVSRTKIDSYYHTDATVTFYDGDDIDELAKAMVLLCRNPSRRRELAANALIYAREQSWDRKKEDYFAIVDALTTRRTSWPSSKRVEYGAKRAT
jgi:glycosyltransferase involved in cell wall biosynthesis